MGNCCGSSAEPDGPEPVRVRYNDHIAGSANVKVAPGRLAVLATDIRATGVQRVEQNQYQYARRRLASPNI